MAKKDREQFDGIDAGKVASLRDAGWSDEAIAEEVGIEAGCVDEIVRNQYEKKQEKKKSEKEDRKQPRLVVLTDEELKQIYERAAIIGAQEALKRFEQERKIENGKRADRRLRNTKLLLRNYRMLKKHAENSVFRRAKMDESAFDILESMMKSRDNDVIISSIKDSAERTAIMLSHVDAMFGLYDAYCDKAENRCIERRRYEVLWDLYMADETLSVKEVAKKHHVAMDTVYTDRRMAIERLSSLIFGVDGLEVT